MTRYEFHPEARVDLRQNLGVPFPHQGHWRIDLTSRPLRFWRVYDYLIAYAPDEDPLWVVAIMHGHQSPRVMAAILRSRE